MSTTAAYYDRLLNAGGDAEVAELLRALPDEWKAHRRSEYMGGKGKARVWLEFECRVWDLGESLRQVLAKKRAWKKSDAIRAACIAIVLDEGLLRGRQPFLELVGRYGGENGKPAILSCLDDPEVAGQAIAAARLAKISEAAPKVRELLASTTRGWIRREAKKFLAKHS